MVEVEADEEDNKGFGDRRTPSEGSFDSEGYKISCT